MMRYTQMFMLEMGHVCNLAQEHSDSCPLATRVRQQTGDPLTFGQRVDLGVAVYEQYGFRGLIGFHFYNEPMLRAGEMFAIMQCIRQRVPAARFILWTNGTITPEDERMRLFDRIVCSNYRDDTTLDAYYRRYVAKVQVNPANGNWQFDGRLADWRANPINHAPCFRPLIEFIVDDWGNGRMCCQDWRGDIPLGNVRDEGGLTAMLRERCRRMEEICGMPSFAPERCQRCVAKCGNVVFVPEIAAAGNAAYGVR